MNAVAALALLALCPPPVRRILLTLASAVIATNLYVLLPHRARNPGRSGLTRAARRPVSGGRAPVPSRGGLQR
ncbi:hypothetical protein GCM10022255_101070 [Dactylosporangium darangshiense]|uniref:Uncharacterized protein n=1 Tax=Dactylosporangium darangshiense TaxID=579108 RepID=A0ABP8DRY2_9ACTN